MTPKRLHSRGPILGLWLCLLLACLPGERPGRAWALVAGGDVMLGRGVTSWLAGEWTGALAQVRPIVTGADLAFANLESPLTALPLQTEGYDLRAPPEAAQALPAAGFRLMTVANNHALDAGPAGLAQTLAALDAAGVRGVTTHHANRLAGQGTPGLSYELIALDDSVDPLDLPSTTHQVAQAARQSDLVILSIHWGGEYQAVSNVRQRQVAHALAGAGANVIVGHGPHVLQPVEWIGGTLVAYSLGNLVFDQLYPLDCRWSALLRVWVAPHQVLAVETIPVVIDRGRVRPAGEQESARILERLSPH